MTPYDQIKQLKAAGKEVVVTFEFSDRNLFIFGGDTEQVHPAKVHGFTSRWMMVQWRNLPPMFVRFDKLAYVIVQELPAVPTFEPTNVDTDAEGEETEESSQ